MSKTLQVVEPFFTLSAGDILELSKDGKSYVNTRNDEFCKANSNGDDISSSYSSTIRFSTAYAKELVEDGYLCEETDGGREFVNIFTEIDRLIEKYGDELESLDEDMAAVPQCVKLERYTVLNNLITLLTHLKGLKK